jgi:Trk-type K+ transport system membrane component
MGGVGLLTFASFFATYIRKGIGIRQQVLMNELFNMDSLNSSFSFVKRMLFLFFGIEAVGVAAIMLSWGDYPFTSFGQKLYFSIFHVGSSFCNAGFTLFPDATKNDIINRMFVWQYIVAAVMILGGLGFPTIIDMFSIRRLRERVRITWKNWELGTKISLYSALILLVVGAVFFFYLFVNSNFQNENLIEKISISFFQSAGLRTTGLGSIDLALASQALILICMFMMFIGGGSSSLAGGIKTSTFVVAFVAIIGTIRGKKEVKLGNRSVPNELIYKAFAIIIFSANFILIVITALSFSDPNIPFLKLTFESVSAFTNTGLSMGITSTLSDAGKVIISIAMFGGRVGVLTLAFALSSKSKPNTIHYPKTHLIIG